MTRIAIRMSKEGEGESRPASLLTGLVQRTPGLALDFNLKDFDTFYAALPQMFRQAKERARIAMESETAAGEQEPGTLPQQPRSR